MHSPTRPEGFDHHDHGDHGYGHGHGHVHSHGLDERHSGRWEDVTRSTPLLITAVLLTVSFLLTLVGLVALWPDGTGQQAATERASELGLGTERLNGVVTEVRDGMCSYASDDDPLLCRDLTVQLLEGADEGALVDLFDLPLVTGAQTPNVSVGEVIVLGYEPRTNFYFYADRNRGSVLLWLTALFVIVVVALGRKRGVRAITAMAITVLVLVGFVARSVLDGNDPLLVALVAASLIAFVSLFLTHGFTPTTGVALVGTLGALLLTLGLSWVFFQLSRFSGLATEEGNTLPQVAEIDLVSLLLGGALLGALGALDDVTVTQVATVAELRYRNPLLTRAELVTSGIRVGREHIASTVNTLLLAYVGAGMPLLLLFALSNQSLASVANSELMAVEIVRTLCGSIGLVAAVPLTTALAAMLVTVPARPDPVDSDAAPLAAGPADDPMAGPDPSGGANLDAAPLATGPGPAADPQADWDRFAPRSDRPDW